jgi:hypothetical protein
MEALLSSETSLLTRAIRRNVPEHGILQVNVDLYIHFFIGIHDVGAQEENCTFIPFALRRIKLKK